MTHAVRALFLLSALMVLAERPAAAQNLGGCAGAVPDPLATFTVPAPAGAAVTISLLGCPGYVIHALAPVGGIIFCGIPLVGVVAGPTGAVFTIGGCGGAAIAGPPCAAVTIAGVPAGPLILSSFDLNCSGGVGAADVSLWIADFISPPYEQRSDYNKDGALGAGDLSMLISVFVGGGSPSTCAPVCP